MAQNLTGHVTTAKRGDTVSEHLSANSLTGNNRFRTMMNAQKMSDAGSPSWPSVYSSIGTYGLMLRRMLTRLIKRK